MNVIYNHFLFGKLKREDMIYGIFLLDSMGFSLMEVFTEEFFTLNVSKRHVFQELNSFNMETSNYSFNGFMIDFAKVDDNHAIGVLVDEKIQAENSLMNELVQLAKLIIQGDKTTIHKIMGIKRSKEIEYLQL